MANDEKPSCASCHDEHYILNGCCGGWNCGCGGQPVSMSNCVDCNPEGDKKAGPGVSEYSEYIEYIEIKKQVIP